MFETLPDSLAADLRDLFADELPVSTETIPAHCRLLRFETQEIPSPRLVFMCGDATRISGQDGTARVPFTVEFSTSMDRVSPQTHRTISGEIDEWLRDVRIEKRRAVLWSRIYLHDLYNNQPQFIIEEDDREQVTRFRGEAIITLAETTF